MAAQKMGVLYFCNSNGFSLTILNMVPRGMLLQAPSSISMPNTTMFLSFIINRRMLGGLRD
ncbi:hypothetical protein B3C1_17347 [Gallaecimonas xiamenensis 3-C-1]|uniref:Uncharacterized protein n=1 Tax=Gallaecimonas xiamenensis 3-C-1 TaxID=745411 RepID=K2JBT0_9GAMM|nr:hypothetical protein B3C1_17347 [Gallaecimonas xiamenensis 3-C-1]